MDRIGDDVVAERIRLAVGQPRLDSAPRGPDGEAAGMVVAAVIGWRQLALAVVGPAKFAAPENQGILEHASLFQILDQGRAPSIGLAAK